MIRFSNIKVREDLNKEELLSFICQKERLIRENVKEWHIVKKSIDARNKDDIFYNYTIDMTYEIEYEVRN